MSATQTNYVHPHLARSRLTVATFVAGTSHGVLGSVRHDRGTERFTTFEDRFGRSSCNTKLVLFGLATEEESRAWALSSHGADAIEPLTPLSQSPLVHPHASATFVGAACFTVRPLWGGFVRVGGCGDCLDHRGRRLVKADAS